MRPISYPGEDEIAGKSREHNASRRASPRTDELNRRHPLKNATAIAT
ncbi:hypothetical protein [Myxosarcina sp. GI1(2024)]